MTLAAVRAAQGRDDEAEELYPLGARQCDERLRGPRAGDPLERLVRFFRARGREDDAAAYEARIAELVPAAPSSTERIA